MSDITEKEVTDVLDALQSFWNEERAEEIANLYHPAAVIVAPHNKGAHEGRDQIYKWYMHGGDIGYTKIALSLRELDTVDDANGRPSTRAEVAWKTERHTKSPYRDVGHVATGVSFLYLTRLDDKVVIQREAIAA